MTFARSRLWQGRTSESEALPPLGWRWLGFGCPVFRAHRPSSRCRRLVFTVARMIVITRDQYVRVSLGCIFFRENAWGNAEARDLSTFVDRHRVRQLQTRTGRNQRIQIDHRAAVLPQECMFAHSDDHVCTIL